MTPDQAATLVILTATLALFVWGRFGPDLVSLAALLAAVVAGLVPAPDAFLGFGHPAVVTVVCVLVLSQALQVSGAIHALVPRALLSARRPTTAILGLTGLAALLSSCINNVGALALLMPVAMQVAARLRLPPARVLLPVAFGASLGGMTTLIGTPPNLIVSSFRPGAGFEMFDFTPVGAAVALAGVLLIGLVGWRLVPRREREGADTFDTGAYLTEARVTEGSKIAGRTLREVGPLLEHLDAQVIGLVRHEFHVTMPHPERLLEAGDVVLVEAEPAALANLLATLGLELAADGSAAAGEGAAPERARAVTLSEVAVRPGFDIVGRSARELELRTRYGVNLLAISRQGRRSVQRLRSEPIRAGDVLLLQGEPGAIAAFSTEHGCVPLAPRAIHLPRRRYAWIAMASMLTAIIATTLGWIAAAPAFALAVVVVVASGVLPPKRAYDAIEWPVVVVLGALVPVAGAMESTGLAALAADMLISHPLASQPLVALGLVLVTTMCLSDVVNNAATAAVMCPIAIGIAARLGVSTDPFLMAVAIGASCAFLTPIGHQNNLIVMGPGGLRFGDYWRLGLPLEAVILAVALVTLPIAMPF